MALIVEHNDTRADVARDSLLRDYIERPTYGFTTSAGRDERFPRLLRITDIREDGSISDLPRCSSEPDSKDLLQVNDIVVARIGATTGKSYIVESLLESTAFASYLIRIRTKPDALLAKYLYYFMQSSAYWRYIDASKGDRLKGGVNIPIIESIPISPHALNVQSQIVAALDVVSLAASLASRSLEGLQQLKAASLGRVFTYGVSGEPQKSSELGPIPESWNTAALDTVARVVSSSMSYEELKAFVNVSDADKKRVLGVKVSDMNLAGNEAAINLAALERYLPNEAAERRCVPPEAIVLPKRGAAIATNKKRLTTTWTVLDPNVIGVVPGPDLDVHFLLHWFQQFDLRTITEPGPTPQLNKKNLDPLSVPVPHMEEQHQIAELLDALDDRIAIQRAKLAALNELFHSLLDGLMTGEININDVDFGALEAGA